MSQQRNDLKPLLLSAEEAMGLLDLCLMSQAEFDGEKERALLKLSALVRQHLAAVNLSPARRSESTLSLAGRFHALTAPSSL